MDAPHHPLPLQGELDFEQTSLASVGAVYERCMTESDDLPD